MFHLPIPTKKPTLTITFFARDMKHAKKLIKQMKSGLKLDGKIYMEIPV